MHAPTAAAAPGAPRPRRDSSDAPFPADSRRPRLLSTVIAHQYISGKATSLHQFAQTNGPDSLTAGPWSVFDDVAGTTGLVVRAPPPSPPCVPPPRPASRGLCEAEMQHVDSDGARRKPSVT